MTSSKTNPFPACDGVPRRLAESGVGRVTACACGNIHFDIEYLTLRFEPSAFMELAEMLAQAQRAVEANRKTVVSVTSESSAVH